MDSFLKREGPPATAALKAGTLLNYQGRTVKVVETISLERIMVNDKDSGQLISAPIHQLKPLTVNDSTKSAAPARDYADYGDKEWDEINRRFEIIFPLLSAQFRTLDDVKKVSETSGFSVAMIYNMIKRFEATRSKTSLLPRKRGRRKGTRLLDDKVEAVIAEGIRLHYLTLQKKSVIKVADFIETRCRTLGIEPPSVGAVRKRINDLEPKSIKHARHSPSESQQEVGQVQTGIPGAERPLDFIQIDHTQVNTIVVDERDRMPLGRPWITLAIDVKTRCVLGIYLSLDSPSFVSVGSAISNMLLTKHDYLTSLELSVEWPMHGAPRKIGADNGADFKSNYLTRSVEDYPFFIEWRPLGGTNFGGHIERLMSTFSLWVRELPGATFASPRERGDYDSKNQAAMTLYELERFIVRHICEKYHKTPHKGLKGATPFQQWEHGILGSPGQPGIGMPSVYSDPNRVRIDFLPFFYRTITRSGITYKNIPYQHTEVFGSARLALERKSGEERQSLFRIDPRDITRVWMWDLALGGYHIIPCAVRDMPAISLSEFKAHERELKSRSQPHDAFSIARHAEDNYQLVEDAKMKTKAAKAKRKSTERRRHNAMKAVKPESTRQEQATLLTSVGGFVDVDIESFEGAEEW
ncbi:MAG: Mu transposase C-terminal domain-containing protein [Marinobacter sp.]